MTRMIIYIVSLMLSQTVIYGQNKTKQIDTVRPKNVILFIGDGMGLAQIHAALTANNGELNMTKMPVTGLIKTYSIDNYITDSGAGGTALATGTKTKNGCIGVDSSGAPVKNIVEFAEDKGLSTGVISTCSIVHATPASFIAHERSREYYENIAKDFLDVDVDVFIGGGYNVFGKRTDSIDLVQQLKEKGYTVLTSIDSVKIFNGNKLAGLTAPEHNLRISEGRGDMLLNSTAKAIEIVSKNNNGFFIMIEGSMIDWGGHENNKDYVIQELLDMDKAVKYANEYAVKNKETLVIVTADHETGGLAIANGNYKTGLVDVTFTTTYHTGIMVPVFAYGPGSELFSGVYDNTEIFKKIKYLLDL